MAKAKNNIWNTPEESHEEFMKQCFGDDFWEKPEDERFMMAMNRVMAYRPNEMEPKRPHHEKQKSTKRKD